MNRRKRLPRRSASTRAAISTSHCFFWRWHHLAVAFVAFVGFGVALGASVFTSPPSETAFASANENVRGWAWADPIGWISLNDQNPTSGGGFYGVNVDLMSGEMNGFAWSENAGWICFGNSCSTPACMGTVPPSNPPYDTLYAKIDPAPYTMGGSIRNAHGWAKVCNLGDEGWISLNCADSVPSACMSYAYRVPFDMTTHQFTDATPPGSPDNGTSFAWNGNGDETGFGFIDFSQAYLVPPVENTEALCANMVDDDLDGATDCTDMECAMSCVPPPDLTEDMCPLGTPDLCCSDSTDNEGDGPIDCDDTYCQGTASMCTVAWLKTKFGNVYAQKGIESIASPASQFNATYCLSISDGTINGFASESGCTATSSALSLPSGATGYRGSLGNVDIAGIENGRYGPVITIADGNALPESLSGGVYVYTGGGTLMLPAKLFQNGVGATGRGNGLLYVKGGNLHIAGNLSYAAPSVDNYLRNLASFGVIVTKVGGTGGAVTVDPMVTTAVGAYFAEESIQTGVSASPLTIYGLLAARQLGFERTGGTSSTAAETVIFDGRAVANPPPGMQDIGKSLPTTKDAF